MFGFNRYLEGKRQSKAIPQEEVSKEEFIRLAVEWGLPLKKAEFQARIALSLGSAVLVGEHLLKIKEEKCDA